VSRNVPSSRWRSAVTLSSCSRSIFVWRDRSGRARSRSPRGRSRPLAACSARMDGALEDLALTPGHCRDASPRSADSPTRVCRVQGVGGSPATGCRSGAPSDPTHQQVVQSRSYGGWSLNGISGLTDLIRCSHLFPIQPVTTSPNPAGNDAVGMRRGSAEAVRDPATEAIRDHGVPEVAPGP